MLENEYEQLIKCQKPQTYTEVFFAEKILCRPQFKMLEFRRYVVKFLFVQPKINVDKNVSHLRIA